MRIVLFFLDSDEDEQDITELKDLDKSSRHEANYNLKRVLNQERKFKQITGAVKSNRFFTDPDNKFFYQNFMNNNSVYIMDAKIAGNIGRFFNHSCTPNLYVQNVFVDTYDLQFPWIAFFAGENIVAGQELVWDYNYTIGSVADRVLYCYCGTRNCRGRLL